MKSDINRLVDRYGQFEQRVRQRTEQWCRPFCSVCRHVCCRVHFCVETRESAFLGLVASCFSDRSVFNDSHGWLTATGCSLVAGRPPVCYEFLCRHISDTVSGDPYRHHALRVSSQLITHVGKHAIGGRHLVEITQATDLNRVDPERFMNRFREADKAFDAVVNVLDGRSSDADIQALSRIVRPPRTDDLQIRRLM
ncbi:hypothetical protein [uncultured Desulfosarcina sp.]|uniref:hypothetical protein n=1 Tax=uncultured Desulfosarcina sp. TaxID=218289 RepID=UPI0029C9068F|nr:hypothetical protein [uncultured Desulfosarcina sp.]